MSEKSLTDRKTVAAYWTAVGSIALSCLIGVLFALHSDQALPLVLGISTLLFGPIVAVAYLIEVKNGVFAVADDGEDESKE